MKFIALIFLMVFNINCLTDKTIQANLAKTSPKLTQKVVFDKSAIDSEKKIEDESNKRKSIKNTIGLLTLSDKYPSFNEKKDKNDFIRIYNEDGSLWYEFTFYYDNEINGWNKYQNDNFNAFAFIPDYFLLTLRCIGKDENRYKVIVNEETGLKKYVNKNDKNLKLENWNEHFLKTFSIDLDEKKNAVFETPGGKEIKVNVGQIERFEAVEVKGDWLKVEWEIPNINEEYKSGWIRWQQDGILLIDWFYIS